MTPEEEADGEALRRIQGAEQTRAAPHFSSNVVWKQRILAVRAVHVLGLLQLVVPCE
jgi:hypothetical protein